MEAPASAGGMQMHTRSASYTSPLAVCIATPSCTSSILTALLPFTIIEDLNLAASVSVITWVPPAIRYEGASDSGIKNFCGGSNDLV
jgi:hypothetical protein